MERRTLHSRVDFSFGLSRYGLISLAALLLSCVLSRPLFAAANVTYVQSNYAVPQSSPTSVTVAFKSAQSAGDLNVVVVGWNNTTASVNSVSDANGNVYVRAVGPTLVSGALSQSIYVAKNIVGGTNSVTVVFSSAAFAPDIRILEYAGTDVSNPIDVTAAATGSGGTTNSGTATTTNPTDLIFGANIVTGLTSGPGSGFTKRILTSPDGDIAEDRMVNSTGSYSATAPASGQWIMQMVAIRTSNGVTGVAPTITSASSTTFTSGVAGSFTLTATGTPTPSLTETGALPSGVTFHDNGNGTATLSGTATATGTFPITITASNGIGAPATQSFTLTVSPANQAPSITSANGTTFTAGTAGSFTVTATGTPTPTLTESGSLPSGLTFHDNGDGTATLAGTASAAGTFPITFTANNGVGSAATQNFTLTVNQAPAITNASSTTFIAGSAASFSVTTTGTPSPSLSQTGTLPSGLTFADNRNGTAVLSGTPAANSSGTYPLTITANNGVGSPANQNFTLTVSPGNQSAPIAFVQMNYATPQGSNSTVRVTYGKAQTSGDLNVVVVGWNDATARVSSVLDSAGNNYVLAVGPTVQSGTATLAIYYAQNITSAAANSNTVTVTFNTGAVSPDIRIAEYGGIATTNAIDVVAAAQGTSGTSNSGSVTTTNPNDLLVGANLVQQLTTGPGTGYTSRVITSPDADILEDSIVTVTGSYSAMAPLSGGNWIMQMVAFRGAANGVTGTSPAITSVASTSFTAGSAGSFTITVTGTPTPAITESGTLPSGITFRDNGNATATLSGMTSLAGIYPITITANNGIGSPATQRFTLTVNQAPTITSASSTTFTAGTAANFAVTTTGTPSPALSETGTLPSGVTFHDNGNGTATLSGTASTAGIYPITISASNGVGSPATQGFRLTVNQAPAISSASSTTFTVGAAGSFAVITTGTPTPSITESGALPGGVSFTDNGNGSATISGIPAAGTAGGYPLTITASNGVGSPATQSFTLTISNSDAQAPTTPTDLTATAASGSQINLRWTASSDNVGVTGYLIERCAGVGCSNFARTVTVSATTYSDTGLVPNTSYTYQVKATDAAGNFSPYSNTATATTQQTIAGLVAAYSFDEGSGNTVTDLSGNGNNGTLINTTWTNSGKFGKALVFDGADSLVTINDSLSLHLTNGLTLEAWVNPSNVSSDWRDVIYKGDDNYFLEGTSSNGPPGGGGTFGSKNSIDFGASTLPTNMWTYLVFTYDGSTLRLYVNGVQVSSTAQSGNIATSTNPLQIGGDSIWGQYFAGMIDEVRIYNVPLNQTQIQADMTTPVSSLASLPVVSINGSSEINFGDQTTGTTSAPQSVTITNSGSSQLSISGIAIFGGNTADFAQTNNCGSALAPGNSCTINVTFTPQATGSRVSSVQITDNAAGSPQVINLSGTGTGFSVSPLSSVLTFTATQQFTASSGGVTWSVDGVTGGSSTVGTITAAGLYTPPSIVGTHTVTAATSTGSASATVYVANYPGTFTFHNDNSRTGQNSSETILNLSNVNEAQFGKLFSYSLDGLAYASPLYVANVNIPGQGYHNVVYIATENDTVYAWDADGLSPNPLWKVSFLKSGVTTVPCGDTGECGDIPNQIGITGTPVIDSSTGTLYVVANTKEGSSYVQRLHALNIATGAEKFGGPVVIQAMVSGSGDGSQAGQLSFDPLKENQRAALLLSNGVVYIAWAAHGDQPPWHGWLMGYNASTLQQTMAYCVTPNGYGGGIWMSNGGLATDSTGNLFFTTGNGDFSANSGGSDYGDSIVKVSPGGNVVDYFTPYDQSYMEADDIDLASAGPVLLLDQPGPIPHLLIAAGKSGSIYVVNRDNMGQFNPNNNSQIVQTLQSILPNGNQEQGNYSAPVYFNGDIYFGAVDDNIKAFQLSSGQLSPAPSSQSSEIYPNRGASFALSANGTSNGILWAVQDNSPSNGILAAYDASDLSHELYNSKQAGSRDTLGVATKFSIPLVANGRVFVIANRQIVAYGLLP